MMAFSERLRSLHYSAYLVQIHPRLYMREMAWRKGTPFVRAADTNAEYVFAVHFHNMRAVVRNCAGSVNCCTTERRRADERNNKLC